MKTNDETRRDNLLLAAQKAGSLTKLSELAGVSYGYLSQIKNATARSGRKKTTLMGDDVARKLEVALGEQTGWMDQPHGVAQDVTRDIGIPAMESLLDDQKRNLDKDIEISQFVEVGGSMGKGILLRDQPGEIHSIHVSQEWITKNVRSHTGAQNLCIVTGFGDSMQPLYNPGDPLLVDRGVTTAEHDGIYFFRIGNEGFIKRLQRIPGVGLLAISDNKLYEKWTITQDMDFEVFAKVVKVWCGSDR